MKTGEIKTLEVQSGYFKKGHTFYWINSTKIVVSTAKKW